MEIGVESVATTGTTMKNHKCFVDNLAIQLKVLALRCTFRMLYVVLSINYLKPLQFVDIAV